MIPEQPQPDPLDGYLANDRDAVHAARPDEPVEAQWDAVRRRIHDRLNPASPVPGSGRWRAAVCVAVGAALTTAAAVAWIAFAPAPTQKPEIAAVRSVPISPETPADPLAEFAVLPMATANEVDISRVPGSGWLPVGSDPLPGTLSLATTDEVELDDPDSVWSQVTKSPGDAPMIFAAKPR